MGEYSASQYVLLFSGVVGGVIAIIKAGAFIAKELEARRQRKIGDIVEVRRLQLDYSDKGIERELIQAWKIVDEKDEQLAEVKAKLKESEQAERLNRPTIMKIYKHIRAIRLELDSLNVLVLDQETTNVFARRWNKVKAEMDEIEAILSGDTTDGGIS